MRDACAQTRIEMLRQIAAEFTAISSLNVQWLIAQIDTLAEQRDAARAERSRAITLAEEYADERDKAQIEFVAARAEAERLQADRERLDFLEANGGFGVYPGHGKPFGMSMSFWGEGDAPALREAIDEAIAAAQPRGGR